MADGMDEAQARVIIARMDEIIDLEVDARTHNGRITDSSYDAAILAAVERMQVAGITPEDWANALVATGEEGHADLVAVLRDLAHHQPRIEPEDAGEEGM